MTTKQIARQLQRIASDDDFVASSAELVDAWRDASLGIESVEPILRFMEGHPEVDYGIPGPLVHFVEEFFERGYEEKLIESIQRKPTAATVWMLNRVINGTQDETAREQLYATMKEAAAHPEADNDTVELIGTFLEDSEED